LARLTRSAIQDVLLAKAEQYNTPAFVATDPVSIPHGFSQKEDREIAGFLSATLAWGQRTTILNSCARLLAPMEGSPYAFVRNATTNDLKPFRSFVHRTFNGEDAVAFLRGLQHVYRNHGGLENIFRPLPDDAPDTGAHISRARRLFFEPDHPARTEKHFADPARGSAAKRINMFLRWMVRRDQQGVDFGLWSQLTPDQLICPLDVHSGRVARRLGLLKRKQDDWLAAVELTQQLRKIDPSDPVKFDIALFGLGVFEKF
jgi:uncharacterized protein (TIGR02757 family)